MADECAADYGGCWHGEFKVGGEKKTFSACNDNIAAYKVRPRLAGRRGGCWRAGREGPVGGARGRGFPGAQAYAWRRHGREAGLQKSKAQRSTGKLSPPAFGHAPPQPRPRHALPLRRPSTRAPLPLPPAQDALAHNKPVDGVPLHTCACPPCFTAVESGGTVRCEPKCSLEYCDEPTGICHLPPGKGGGGAGLRGEVGWLCSAGWVGCELEVEEWEAAVLGREGAAAPAYRLALARK